VKLYRVMKLANDGKPLVGTRRNMLGVRPTDPNNRNPKRRFDVNAVDDADLVFPGEGLSTTPDRNSQATRVGSGEALFEIDTDELGADLAPMPDRSDLYLIEPSRPMTLSEYQQALSETLELWKRV